LFAFKLSESFLSNYKSKTPPFGFRDAAGNSVGEIVFMRTYSRLKEDGTKERWWEVCERVISGMYTIQKNHCRDNRLPWDGRKAQRSAQEAYDRLFNLKWSPPGRGLWLMGTPMVMEDMDSTGLQNCSFVSTADMSAENPGEVAAFLMEASMLGVGVGFDVLGAEKGFTIHTPGEVEEYTVPDTRQGWAESTRLLINSYLCPDSPSYRFDYSAIRPAGSPIATFGGTAAGPEPLVLLHSQIRELFDGRAGQELTELDIMDIMNQIGVCVVSGNVRRSAELALGRATDKSFINAKNYVENPYREPWGFMSNNSVFAEVGQDLTHLVDNIASNGEPGVVWMDVSRAYGRLNDPENWKDRRAAGYNPCAEQTLESWECCTLVETYLNRHESYEDYAKTLKYAYLYAKTVTLLPTKWERTNAIMQRNRRVGVGVSGIANFADTNGLPELRRWLDDGYGVVQHYDTTYSEWLCVRESIKTTTVKPSGTVSILAGESPGVHWSPGGEYFKRGIVFSKDDPMVELLKRAGYKIEKSSYNPNSVFIQFKIHSGAKRSEKEVSIYEKANLAALAQRFWSDNSVSCTVSFDPKTEAGDVGRVLSMYDGQLKTISFLPMDDKTYKQMPYQSCTQEDWENDQMTLFPISLDAIYDGEVDSLDAEGESLCTTDACEIKNVALNSRSEVPQK
jgi:ribonucleoside-triphosphate reductase